MQDDLTKKGSVKEPSSHKKKVRFSMEPAKKQSLDDESSDVKLLKFRKFSVDEIEAGRDEVQMEEDQDPPLEDEGKKLNLWGGQKSFNLSTPVKTPEKLPKVALSKFRYFSENELETTNFIQIHNTENKPKAGNKISKFLTKTGFLLEEESHQGFYSLGYLSSYGNDYIG